MTDDKPISDPDIIAEEFLAAKFLFDPDPEGGITEESLQGACYTLRSWRDEFFVYDLGRYIKVSDAEMKATIKEYLHDRNAEAKLVSDAPPISITLQRVNNIILCLKGMKGVHLTEQRKMNSWNSGLEKLLGGVQTVSFENRLLTITDGEPALQPHTPKYFSTVKLPYKYDPDAKCDKIVDFLMEVFDGDTERVELIMQWLGYLWTPNLRAQKFLLCAGEGANGKGVLFELIERMVGPENCSHVPLANFGEQFILVQTLGKVVNLTSESGSQVTKFAETTLKNFTAGDAMSFQRKYRDPIEAVPTAKVSISTNALPRFHDKTSGTWRRMLFVPFNKTIPEDKQNPNLADELSEELPGLFNFALAGMESLKDKGFVQPEICQEALEDYKRLTNPARAFLTDNYTTVTLADDEGERCDEVYEMYVKWCKVNGYRPLNNVHLGKEVFRVMPTIEKTRVLCQSRRVQFYQGMKMKKDCEINNTGYGESVA